MQLPVFFSTLTHGGLTASCLANNLHARQFQSLGGGLVRREDAVALAELARPHARAVDDVVGSDLARFAVLRVRDAHSAVVLGQDVRHGDALADLAAVVCLP